MVTPFSSKQPIIIDMIAQNKGVNIATSSNISATTGTTLTMVGINLDWSKFTGDATWNILYGHANASTAAGGMKVMLYDFTNASILYTYSSNTSNATNTDSSTMEGTTVSFTKPNGSAKVAIIFQNNDTTTRVQNIQQSWIVISE